MLKKDIANDAHPMHRIDKQLEVMTGANVFITLDLTKGYHLLLLQTKSKPITAFSSPKSLFQ